MSALGEVLRRRVQALVRHQPLPGVTYPESLIVDDPLKARWRVVVLALAGSMLGLVSFYAFVPVVISVVVWIGWLVSGSPGDFASFGQAATRFELPVGMLATNLGLSVFIPISFALVLFVHRFHPRVLHSVQPGFRWRFGFVALLAGFVVLTAVWVVSRLGQPWVFAPEREAIAFLIVILLSSPLQAAAEEYFFRGYLLQSLHTAAPESPLFGVVSSAAVFALMHGTQNLPLFLYRFVFGVLAGYLVLKTGGLEAGIAAHVVNNVVAYGYATLSGGVAAVHAVSQIGWVDLAWSLFGFALFAAVAIWISGRMKLATTTPGVRFGSADEV